jgi:hypothetical protein
MDEVSALMGQQSEYRGGAYARAARVTPASYLTCDMSASGLPSGSQHVIMRRPTSTFLGALIMAAS